MGKYEDAVRLKAINEQLIEKFEAQIDKHPRIGGLGWAFLEIGRAGQMLFQTRMVHRYHDSASSDWTVDSTETAGKELAKTLNELKDTIIRKTVMRLRQDIRDAQVAAADEAKDILAAVNALKEEK